MMEEQLYQMSGDHSGSNQGTTTTDDDTVHLPAYLAFIYYSEYLPHHQSLSSLQADTRREQAIRGSH